MKTLAAKELDRLNIHYELREFVEESLDAMEAAEKLNIPLAQVFKTLVVRGDRTGVMLACVPGTKELSLRLLAKLSGNKRVNLVDVEEIHRLTGYLRGGCSPLGGRKRYPVFIDIRAIDYPFICISAGIRGLQILISPQDLIRAAEATSEKITERPHC
jgi:Cys-tRNA(Pro)/Cys-tRNA(Cys) deacylase